jgi:hypothetical protein
MRRLLAIIGVPERSEVEAADPAKALDIHRSHIAEVALGRVGMRTVGTNSDYFIAYFFYCFWNGQNFSRIGSEMILDWSELESEMIWVEFRSNSILSYFHQNYFILPYLK